MERRLAITYAVSTSIVLSAACVAVATVSGGLFVQAAPGLNAGIKKVEMIDDYIVVHSPTTTPSTVEVTKAYIVAPPSPAPVPDPTVPPSTESAPEIVNVQPPAPAPAHTPAPAVAPMPDPAPVVHEQDHRISPPTTDGTPDDGQSTSTHHHSGGGYTGGGGGGGEGGGGGDD